jgi:hypothetical protein
MTTSAVVASLENAKARLEKTLSYLQGGDWNSPTAVSVCKQLDLIDEALAEAKGENKKPEPEPELDLLDCDDYNPRDDYEPDDGFYWEMDGPEF